jgi:hypothetical protein
MLRLQLILGYAVELPVEGRFLLEDLALAYVLLKRGYVETDVDIAEASKYVHLKLIE